MSLPVATDVLVVGAGPTGLALATALATLDVDVTIVDSAAARRTESRAAGVQPRALEDLARLGVADALVEQGLRGKGFRATTRERTLLEIDFDHLDTPYPYVLLVPQPVTEQVLEDGLRARGGQVLRGHRVLSIDEEHSAVSVLIAAPDGTVRNIRARYVVGADGLHSSVRTRAGIGFTGANHPEHYALADVRLSGFGGTPQVCFSFAPGGLLLLSPLPNGQVRMVATVDHPEPGYDAAAVRRIIDERAPAGEIPAVTEVVQSRPYQVTTWLADSFRSGRTFLAGDAAHVHSPAGGQGMNTGIQDAVNLAWKLAEVLRGNASDALLDTYDAERRPNAQRLLAFTDQLTAISTMSAPDAMAIRDHLLREAGTLPQTRRLLANQMSQLAVGYPRPGADPLVGTRISPQAPWGTTLAWTLLLPPGAEAPHTAMQLGESPTDAAILLRPDGYVADTATRDGINELLAR